MADLDDVYTRFSPYIPKSLSQPVIQEFQRIIEEDATLFMAFHQIFEQIPDEPRYKKDPNGKVQANNYSEMLHDLNRMPTFAPEFGDKQGPGSELAPAPICGMLSWPMCTTAGMGVFTHPTVNARLRKILNWWAEFLSSGDSCYILTSENPRGWFTDIALAAIYHRWHAPVSGMIIKVLHISGTYYAISPTTGFHGEDCGELALDKSQAFLSSAATRMIILIEAENTSIGLMAFIAIGMAEISSCEETVKVGERVKKGDELGTFHYGGSSYCMIFRPATEIMFDERVTTGLDDGETKVLVNS
ncbi:hypothetical protein NP233_g6154 [Leucocoprinus birnbaumii]|uniref:L-tryptophan decarboxylase PsiD-like domain-containing protein n=1 Tax=Leucocoprinus birnbaumii TaxID=56174 RepID=A0AAD5VTU3_9AGAR|nr:hypothetical protein NP233_g6154 [Leucocoprinus birnbaumii]